MGALPGAADGALVGAEVGAVDGWDAGVGFATGSELPPDAVAPPPPHAASNTRTGMTAARRPKTRIAAACSRDSARGPLRAAEL